MNLVLVLIIAGILLPKESLSGRRPARRFRPRGHNAAISRQNEITTTITKGQWKKPQKLKEGTEKLLLDGVIHTCIYQIAENEYLKKLLQDEGFLDFFKLFFN